MTNFIKVTFIATLLWCFLPNSSSAQEKGETSERYVDSVEIYYLSFYALTRTNVKIDNLTAIADSGANHGRITLRDSVQCIRLYNALPQYGQESEHDCEDLRIAVKCYVKGADAVTWGLSQGGVISFKGKCFDAGVNTIVLLFSCLPKSYVEDMMSLF